MTAPRLHNLGVKVRSISQSPGYPTAPLPGSNKLPTLRQPTEAPAKRVVRITKGPAYTHDARIQCAPGERPYGAGFAAAGPGRNIETGRAWE